MPKKMNLKLDELEVQSFVTLNDANKQDAKGGLFSGQACSRPCSNPACSLQTNYSCDDWACWSVGDPC